MDEQKLVPGSVFGGMLLVAGSCIGAGMLALPILSGLSGFFPSLIGFFSVWFFMTFTALLLVEVNGWFYSQINIVSMAGKAFGKTGKIISWFLYLFLFYSLLVAYISGSGSIFSTFINSYLSVKISPMIISIVFSLFFGIFVYFNTKTVDFVNRLLMAFLVTCYLAMIFIGINKISPKFLTYSNYKYLLFPLPVLITSFGFHNMIPSLVAYFKGDLKRMRITILGGSVIALVIYLFWQLLVLGIVPADSKMGIHYLFLEKKEASEAISHFAQSKIIIDFAKGFSFFAIVTSFLAQSLGLMHFIADGLKIIPNKKNNLWLCPLTIIPPLIMALIYPKIFFQALGFAGGFCAAILFGIFPILMVWIGRYKKKISSSYHVRGGKIMLIIAFFFFLFIVLRVLFRLFY